MVGMADQAFLSLLNNEFDLYELANTHDGQGGFVKSHVFFGVVRGRIRPNSPSNSLFGQQLQQKVTHTLYLASPSSIERGWAVGWGGMMFKVLAVRQPSLAGHHLEIDLEMFQRENPDDLGS